MKLEWMGDYREVVEQLIKYCNLYSACYKKEQYLGTEEKISYAQIQVIEYILENEELNMNMKQLASRLGITTSNFSKLVHKLETRGLLEKFHTTDNRKDVIIRVTDHGKKLYADYSDFIYTEHFSKMFHVADKLPREDLPIIADSIKASYFDHSILKEKKAPKLVPIQKK